MGKQNTLVWTMVWILVGGGVVYIAVCTSLPHQTEDEGRSDRGQLLMAPGLWVSRTLWYGLIRVGGSVVPHQTEDEGRSDRRQLLMAPGLWVSRTLWYGLWCGYW